MTVFLTPQQILFIHAWLIEATGGSHGLRDLGLLESAAARPRAAFGGTELYPDIFDKAAALMESLAQNHPFVDGNKRTAITATALFLRQNGHRLQTTNEELERFTLMVVNERPSLEEAAIWFQHYTVGVD
ncbi:MAG TPA: type II toxin-antitoxin system death-on-curing family toxin [Anaerolineae bacterium]|nr:type II toxin-antitoxin system death-on-curing family toxin [Anaerolineae bacterium]